jgi:GT2 family glycosyltransferase
MTGDNGRVRSPTVTIVFLVYNRREELRRSLRRMLVDSDYDPARVDAIVVDNASTDGSGEMVRHEFPQVQLLVRDSNVGISGWNDGFARARGEFVLTLDDDCYLPRDGLRRAVEEARRHGADLVSFSVVSDIDEGYSFSDEWRGGLLAFWGCAVLMRRRVLERLGGFDPNIFCWAHEIEFMLRFFDEGYRHLHLPEVVARHIKEQQRWEEGFPKAKYRMNERHVAYIAGKLLHPRDAVEALVALFGNEIRNGLRVDSAAFKAVIDTAQGFFLGLRHRRAVRNPAVSHAFRRNFHAFASPWWMSRPPAELLRSLPREILGRQLAYSNRPVITGNKARYYAERARFYPEQAATLQF